jgi:hypothetical protein
MGRMEELNQSGCHRGGGWALGQSGGLPAVAGDGDGGEPSHHIPWEM